MRIQSLLALCAGLAITAPAFAIDADGNPDDADQRDLEYREANVSEEQDRKVEVNGGFESQWHEYDNVDFRPYDDSSDQEILDSDDRGSFAFTGIYADVGLEIDDKTRFVLGVSHRGLWGNDQLGNTNVFGGWMYFTAAYAEVDGPANTQWKIGRQFFQPGGIAGSREYILSDIVDMVRVDIPVGPGTLTVIPINVAGGSVNPDDVTLVRYVGQSSTQSFNFKGDRMTRRYGAMFSLDDDDSPLDVRLYGFYSDIGSLGSGSDITYNGRVGNFSDNDWVVNAGARGSFEIGSITPFLAIDYSNGIDRKEAVAVDVLANGVAGKGGVVFDNRDEETRAGLRAELSGFYSQGALYYGEGDRAGLKGSHGFVGMKARHVGGTLANRYLGMHPTPYVGMFGVESSEHNAARKSGTMEAHASVGYTAQSGFGARLSYWFLQDTGASGLWANGVQSSDISAIDPPFGYSRREFMAQRRLGLILGQEINLDLSYELTEAVTLRANGATFLPGDFYAVEVDRVAGNQLGSPTPATAWSVSGGTVVKF